MEITKDLVFQLADLTRLEMSDAEAEQYRHDLAAILDYAQNLNAVDTAHIPPTAHVTEGDAPLGEDVPGPVVRPEELAQMAGDAFDAEERVFVLQGVLAASPR